jgi:acetyl-CoA C-acetyltransferase
MGDACNRIAKGEIAAAAVVGGEAGYRILRPNITGTKWQKRSMRVNPTRP